MKNLIAQCNFTDLHADRTKSAANRMAPMENQWCIFIALDNCLKSTP